MSTLEVSAPAVRGPRQIAPHIPERLDGLTALDVGCNAGFYIDEHYLAQARWAAREFGLDDRIELGQLSVYDLARTAEQYDLVLLLGVLYHLRHPLLALDVLQRITRRQLILQTLTMPGERVLSARPGHEIYVCTPLESEPPIPAAMRAAELRAVFAIPGEPP